MSKMTSSTSASARGQDGDGVVEVPADDLLKELDARGATGLDLSPGDPVCREAAAKIRHLLRYLTPDERKGEEIDGADLGGAPRRDAGRPALAADGRPRDGGVAALVVPEPNGSLAPASDERPDWDESYLPAPGVREQIVWILTKVASWTSARWDQHLRYEYGDEKTDAVIHWLGANVSWSLDEGGRIRSKPRDPRQVSAVGYDAAEVAREVAPWPGYDARHEAHEARYCYHCGQHLERKGPRDCPVCSVTSAAPGKKIPPWKCPMHDCPNRSDQGRFVDMFCAPCHQMIMTGSVGPGETFVHALSKKIRLLDSLLALASGKIGEQGEKIARLLKVQGDGPAAPWRPSVVLDKDIEAARALLRQHYEKTSYQDSDADPAMAYELGRKDGALMPEQEIARLHVLLATTLRESVAACAAFCDLGAGWSPEQHEVAADVKRWILAGSHTPRPPGVVSRESSEPRCTIRSSFTGGGPVEVTACGKPATYRSKVVQAEDPRLFYCADCAEKGSVDHLVPLVPEVARLRVQTEARRLALALILEELEGPPARDVSLTLIERLAVNAVRGPWRPSVDGPRPNEDEVSIQDHGCIACGGKPGTYRCIPCHDKAQWEMVLACAERLREEVLQHPGADAWFARALDELVKDVPVATSETAPLRPSERDEWQRRCIEWEKKYATLLDSRPTVPVPMVLHCPECRTRHVDVGDFATRVHHTHSCQSCGLTWRPAVQATVGVQFLPGFRDGDAR